MQVDQEEQQKTEEQQQAQAENKAESEEMEVKCKLVFLQDSSRRFRRMHRVWAYHPLALS